MKISEAMALLPPGPIRSALIVAPHGVPWLGKISDLFEGIPNRPQAITVLTKKEIGTLGPLALWRQIFRGRFHLVLQFIEHDPKKDPIAFLRLACFPVPHRFLCTASPAQCQKVTVLLALKATLTNFLGLVRQIYLRHIDRWVVSSVNLIVWVVSRAFVPIWEAICRLAGRRKLKSLDDVRRILFVALDNPGDLLLATPCLAALKERFPSAKLTVLAGEWGRELLSFHPAVSRVIVYHPPWFEKYIQHLPHKPLRPVRDFLSCVSALWHERFDLVVETRGEAAHIVLSTLSGAPYRVGYAIRSNLPWLKPQSLAHLLTHEVPFDWSQWHQWHKVDYNLQVIAALGGKSTGCSIKLSIPAQAVATADDLLKAEGIFSGELLIGVCPGASRKEKRWNTASFAQVLDHLMDGSGGKVIVIGSPQEVSLAREMAGQMIHRPVVLAGRTTVLEAAALIQRCQLLICNDSLPTHIASAVGTPVVSISRAPAHFYAPHQNLGAALTRHLPCMNVGQPDGCHCPFSKYWCLQAVTPEEAIRVVQDLIGKELHAHRN